jgi:hypothetical protein
MAYDVGFMLGILFVIWVIVRLWQSARDMGRYAALSVRHGRAVRQRIEAAEAYEHPVYRQIRERKHR